MDRADVQEALRIQLALILGGGYPKSQRYLSQAIRNAVIARDNGQCRKCGEPGSQIDHILGSSSDLSNLQLLCPKCHNEKTTAGFITITPASHPKEWAKRKLLLARVRAQKTTRLCDSSDWVNLWRVIQKARRDFVKNG